MLRGELLLNGLDFPFGSSQEALANAALQRRTDIQYKTTLAIINAILTLRPGASVDGLRKSIDELAKVLFPGEADRLAKRAAEVGELIQREVAKGPLRFKVVDDGSRKAKKRRRKR